MFRVAQIAGSRTWTLRLVFLLAVLCSSEVLLAQSLTPAQLHAQRAHEYLIQKKPKLAIPELEAVLATDPTNLDAQANLGVLLFFQQNYSAAVPYLRQAVAQDPGLSKIHALLGLAEQYLGKIDDARTDLEAAVPQLTEPAIRVQAGLTLIEIDAASQNLTKAADVVALLREVAPTDPRVLYTAYRIATKQAGEAMLSLSLVAPDSAQMHQAMAQELERAREIPGAIANLRKAAELDPLLPDIHYELAEALSLADDAKDRAEAESQYKLALEQNPRDARSAVALGNLAREHGDLTVADGYYRKAFAIDAHLPEAAIALANVDIDNEDFAAAASKLEQVLQDDPTNILAHYQLSGVYRRLGRPEDAKRELDAFQRYTKMKERMRAIYDQMRQQPPSNEGTEKESVK
jgi:tetratricopeptide (TPR) repeat protein